METIANSSDDILIDNLSYKLGSSASYLTDRKSVTFFPSGSNIYKTTSGTTVSTRSGLSIQALGRPAVTTGVVSSAESSEATRNIVIGTSATPPDVGSVDTNTIYFQREA